jgi:dTMP kinase
LDSGATVICDRFLLANVVYQGVAGGLNVEDLWSVGRCATGGLSPDVTVILDLEPEAAAARIQRGADRLEKRGIEYFKKVRLGFLEQVQRASSKSLVVDASGSVDAIHSLIRTFVDAQQVNR